jgi:hypothetical protein
LYIYVADEITNSTRYFIRAALEVERVQSTVARCIDVGHLRGEFSIRVPGGLRQYVNRNPVCLRTAYGHSLNRKCLVKYKLRSAEWVRVIDRRGLRKPGRYATFPTIRYSAPVVSPIAVTPINCWRIVMCRPPLLSVRSLSRSCRYPLCNRSVSCCGHRGKGAGIPGVIGNCVIVAAAEAAAEESAAITLNKVPVTVVFMFNMTKTSRVIFR